MEFDEDLDSEDFDDEEILGLDDDKEDGDDLGNEDEVEDGFKLEEEYFDYDEGLVFFYIYLSFFNLVKYKYVVKIILFFIMLKFIFNFFWLLFCRREESGRR